MATAKLSRAEKKQLEAEKKLAKLEKMREKIIPSFKEPAINKEPIVLEIPNSLNEAISIEVPPELYTPKILENPDSYKSMCVEFHLDKKDTVGEWSWGLDRSRLDSEFKTIIEPYLIHPTNTKWGTLLGERYGKDNKTKHHHMDLGGLSDEIQSRWQEIELDYPEVFTFRFSGTERLWGFRIINKYFIVWWDPKHELIPS